MLTMVSGPNKPEDLTRPKQSLDRSTDGSDLRLLLDEYALVIDPWEPERFLFGDVQSIGVVTASLEKYISSG